jgi:hypothetical protein
MNRRRFIFVAVFALLVVAAVLRWPRLESGIVSVTHSEVDGDQMVVEYRMSRPFEVALFHGVREPIASSQDPGVRVMKSRSLRREDAGTIPSVYDMLWGEHYVRLRFRRGPSLTIEANGRHLAIVPWLARDATSLIWLPPGEHTRYGGGTGNDIVRFAESPEQQEYLMLLYAGTNVEK